MNRKFSTLAVGALFCAAASAQYCAVNNTFTACGNDESIGNVTVGAFVNSSGCGPGGYEDHTGLGSTPLTVGVAANVSVTIANFWAGDKVTLWIDLNGDLAFGAGEAFDLPDSGAGGNGGASVVVSGTLTIPTCTPPGLGRRMRVAMNYNMADPQPACGAHNFGAWEDYLVDVFGPVLGDTCDCPLTANFGATAGTMAGATVNNRSCSLGQPNVWYAFTPATTDVYEMTVTDGPHVAGVYAGPCGALTSVACSEVEAAQAYLTAGVTYHVEVAGWSGAPFTLNIGLFVPAVNDECSGALPIFVGVTPGVSNAVGASNLGD